MRAETRDGIAAAEERAVIQPIPSAVLLYEEAPLAGVLFNRALAGVVPFTKDEMAVRAFTLFASTGDSLSYEWKLNGEIFDTESASPLSATFRKSGAGGIAHTVTFSFKNPAKFLEHAARSFQLSF